MKNILAFLGGSLVWAFFWWLGSGDFPDERGSVAVFYFFFGAMFGIIGVCVYQVAAACRDNPKQ